jgi:tetratricopeptide (TPR) repeat protein
MTNESWQQRIDAIWAAFDQYEPGAFVSEIERLASELPPGDAAGLFELASAHDSTGQEEKAAPLYRQAIAAGLTGPLRRRAIIQLASTLRNLGQIDESVALLTTEQQSGSDNLDDAVSAFLALSLTDAGREREAVAMALGALARHLPRYNRSLANYAKALTDQIPAYHS